MSDKVKLIIEIPKPMYESIQNGIYCGTLYEELKNGIPLDDVKDIIRDKKTAETDVAREYYNLGLGDAINILDNIGKTEREGK